MPENGGAGSLDHTLRKILEDNFENRLVWQHNSDSRKAHRRWPDWVIGRRLSATWRPRDTGRTGVIIRELKRQGKDPTGEQQEWLDILAADGLDVGVWRPEDYYSGRIARELAALAGLGGAA